ncbi:MAG: PhnD/SsuA/transferrin family substrate-binding protein [Gammaproteobacteria bacterium]|nr:PhnD/SsuA/transferrin family substrate-binding protein [Gammaproteobacteria bacterium]
MKNRYFAGIFQFILLAGVYQPTVLADYVFTSAPRETIEESIAVYQPIADFLTRVTGEKFVLRTTADWSDYTIAMKNQEYDVAFDGAHFVSWRIKYINHEIIAKLPDLLIWRLVSLKDRPDIKTLDDMIGKKMCAPKSPNFGYLIMMSHYTDPDHEPVQVVTKSWKDGYDGVMKGECDAAVMPKANHLKFDPELVKSKAVYTHLPYPNQAFTAGPKLSSAMKEKVRNAILSDEGQAAASLLRERFAPGTFLVSAENEEYEGISLVLKRAENFGTDVKVSTKKP